MFKSNLKGKRVVVSSAAHLSNLGARVSCLVCRFLLSFISVVGNVSTFALPADITLLCFFGGVEKYLFSFLVGAFVL